MPRPAMPNNSRLAGWCPQAMTRPITSALDYSQYLDAAGSQLLVSASRYRSEPGTRIRLDNGREITPVGGCGIG